LASTRATADGPAVFDGTTLGVFVTDASGAIYDANDAFLRMVGYERDDLREGRLNWRAMTPPEYEVHNVLALAALRATGIAQGEKEFVRKDGSRIPVLLSAMLGEGDAERGRGLALVMDLTERRRHEWEREERLAVAQRARDEADAAARRQDFLLASTYHDLRTPIAAIIGWISLLREEDRPELVREGLEGIGRQAVSLSDLVEDLLDAARARSDALLLSVASMDVSRMVQAAIEPLRLAAADKRLDLDVRCDPATPSILGDTRRLQQVVWNLVSNAIKFTPAGGRVEVRLHADDDRVYLVVRDSGQGIPPKVLSRLFEPFVQERPETARRGGLGLGLAIVRRIVELHGGEVGAHSDGIGRGATFTVGLPRAR
jgi:PAS domain S-box-containing protein